MPDLVIGQQRQGLTRIVHLRGHLQHSQAVAGACRVIGWQERIGMCRSWDVMWAD